MMYSEGTAKLLTPLLVLGAICLIWSCWSRDARVARSRFLATIKTMAQDGPNQIDGQPVEHWLKILNHNSAYSLDAMETILLKFRGLKWFFLDGNVVFPNGRSYGAMKGFFLIAIDQSAVCVLDERKDVFRLITGSAELAAFSIYDWKAFLDALKAEGE